MRSTPTRRALLAALIGCSALVLTLSGCAKFPEGGVRTGKQLVLTMRVRGTINPIDPTDPSIRRHYFIAIDNDGDPNTGPWAAIFPPYGGNGWVTSQNADQSIGVTSYIRYDATNPEAYLYGILPGSFFLNVTPPQPPIRAELLEGGRTLRVVVDFGQIATAQPGDPPGTGIPADQIQQLDINFITTNSLPLTGEYVPGRIWDALGPSGKNYMTIDTTADNFKSDDNADGPPVTDPDLDIVFCSAEVQTVSSR